MFSPSQTSRSTWAMKTFVLAAHWANNIQDLTCTFQWPHLNAYKVWVFQADSIQSVLLYFDASHQAHLAAHILQSLATVLDLV